ncbi:MAG TPA: bifunctional glutamate N-acetyltransferase/amino-acid acetyltransferase ArgJ [Candidatus Omnitrophota bacterium]|nr:bifunctional glutamate N-acetyltransferase/amino-acid acetyltransferase ArgJ [Candidatus Omnitrophota bacterium]
MKKLKGVSILKNGSMTSAKGFVASGMHCGIKRSPQKYDLSLVVSEKACNAAAVFTVNRAKAWPVYLSIENLKNAKHFAIIGTSGNANCLNGPQGKQAAWDCLKGAADELHINPKEVLIAQTGIIGVRYPTQRVTRSLSAMVQNLSRDGGHAAAKGILTTDKRTKEIAVSFSLSGKKVTIGAAAKGAGMVHPYMATMLCFITTDAAIAKPLLQKALRAAVETTFNAIAIDNDMSTNDTAFILANGAAGNSEIKKENADYKKFAAALEYLLNAVAVGLVEDGEGVKHVCHITVQNAKSDADAAKAARQIGNSMLFKTMVTGEDPNWGRIIAAVGASQIPFNPNRFSVYIGGTPIVKEGLVRVLNRPKAKKAMALPHFDVTVDLYSGKGKATFVTSDLTHEYVSINGAYS